MENWTSQQNVINNELFICKIIKLIYTYIKGGCLNSASILASLFQSITRRRRSQLVFYPDYYYVKDVISYS